MQKTNSNTDFWISILNMEYAIYNMSVLIPCQEPTFFDITIVSLNNQDNLGASTYVALLFLFFFDNLT